MTESLYPYLIVCPLVFLAGFVDAIAGGGGLISLPAYLISGIPPHLAIGTNKMGACMGTALATYQFAKNGYIQWKFSLICAACALVGSVSGANLVLLIPESAFKMVMLVILPLTALYVLRGKTLASQDKPPHSPSRTLLLSTLIALAIGLYDGFYGPGTGTFLLLLLTGAARLGLREAAGTTKVINLTTNVAALSVFLLNGTVLWQLGLAAGCFSIAGNYLGARFFAKKGSAPVKPLIIGVLVLFFIKVIWDMISS